MDQGAASIETRCQPRLDTVGPARHLGEVSKASQVWNRGIFVYTDSGSCTPASRTSPILLTYPRQWHHRDNSIDRSILNRGSSTSVAPRYLWPTQLSAPAYLLHRHVLHRCHYGDRDMPVPGLLLQLTYHPGQFISDISSASFITRYSDALRLVPGIDAH